MVRCVWCWMMDDGYGVRICIVMHGVYRCILMYNVVYCSSMYAVLYGVLVYDDDDACCVLRYGIR